VRLSVWHSQLYGITPDGVPAHWIAAAAQASFAAGLKILQLRSKHLSASDKRTLAIQLIASAKPYGAAIIINDDAALAHATGADGVHLGGTDGDIAAARNLLGAHAIIGASCYGSVERARVAAAQGASYVAFGALYGSSTKPNAPRAVLTLFADACDLAIPMVGIGGISTENARQVIAAGASAVAVVNALFPDQGTHTVDSYCALVASNTQHFLNQLNTDTAT
jgi:thiamine-phosphate pyrophosphorylase